MSKGTKITPRDVIKFMPEIYKILKDDFNVDKVTGAKLQYGILTIKTDSDKEKFKRRDITIGLVGLRASK